MGFTDLDGRTYWATLTHYETRLNPPDGRPGPELPTDPGLVHATATWKTEAIGTGRQPRFLRDGELEPSVCGKAVCLILPLAFNPDDPDACPRCAAGVRQHEGMQTRHPHADGDWYADIMPPAERARRFALRRSKQRRRESA